jgi:hypothetical protein
MEDNQCFLDDTAAYLSSVHKELILGELYYNAYRTIHSVYLFNHFNDYATQLLLDRNEDKTEIYWNAAFDERLIDRVKISIAFETYNKAVLLENGYLIHRIKKDLENKELFDKQENGYPIKLTDFLEVSSVVTSKFEKKTYLSGLRNNFDTIAYSVTLNPKYQEIIKIDAELCGRLIKINKERNKLHLFTNHYGAFIPEDHIQKWTYIRNKSIETIDNKYKERRS